MNRPHNTPISFTHVTAPRHHISTDLTLIPGSVTPSTGLALIPERAIDTHDVTQFDLQHQLYSRKSVVIFIRMAVVDDPGSDRPTTGAERSEVTSLRRDSH